MQMPLDARGEDDAGGSGAAALGKRSEQQSAADFAGSVLDGGQAQRWACGQS